MSAKVRARARWRDAVLLSPILLACHAVASEWQERVGSERPSARSHVVAAVPLEGGGFALHLWGESLWYDEAGGLQYSAPGLDWVDRALGQHGRGLILQQPQLSWSDPSLRLAPCRYQSLGTGWTVRALDLFHRAGDYGTDPNGGLLVADVLHPGALFWIDADCHAMPVPWPQRDIGAVVTAADLPLGYVIDGDPWRYDQLHQVHRDGEVEWTRALPTVAQGHVLMRRLETGGIVWAGQSGGQVHAERIDANGAVIWAQQVAVSGQLSVLDVQPDGSASLWLAADQDEAEVIALDASGTLRARHALGTAWIRTLPSVQANPVHVLADSGYPRNFWTKLVRVEPDGGLATIATLAEGELPMAETASGTVLVLETVEDAPGVGGLRLIAADGSTRELPLPPRAMDVRTAGMDSDSDGIAWVVEDSAGSSHVQLLALDGTVLWVREVEAGDADDARPRYLVRSVRLLPDHVCVFSARLHCWRRDDGAHVLRSEPLEGDIQWGVVMMEHAGDLVLAYARNPCPTLDACTGEIVRRIAPAFSALGAPEVLFSRAGNTGFRSPLVTPDGTATWIAEPVYGGETTIYRVASDGSPGWSWSDGRVGVGPAEVAHDGAVLMATHDGKEGALVQLAPNGAEAWRQTMSANPTRLAAVPDGWLLAHDDADTFGITLLDRTAGDTRWQQSWNPPDNGSIGSLRSMIHSLRWTGGDGFAAIRSAHGRALVEWRALADGALRAVTSVPWPGEASIPEPGVLLLPGDVREGRSTVAQLLRIEADLGRTAVDPTLDGAWFMPHASGQGLFLRALPHSGQVYGAWFTYGPAAGEDRANLRWYTLSGETHPGGSAQLTLYRNGGGRFASPPATDAIPAGRANLVRTGCDTAWLEYAFDAPVNDGMAGAIPLQRLGGTGCAGDVDDRLAALSGAFSVPTASGQGVLFAPGAGDVARLDAFWFTYDPVGSADDPDAQHWFTLHATGPVEPEAPIALEIRRSIGGTFDAMATDNNHRVGTATVEFHDCNHATLAYDFDDRPLTGAFAGLEGSLPLARVDTCPAGL